MTPKERPYKDKEINIRDRETVKLSELTKDERDIYFAGVKTGGVEADGRAMLFILLVTAVTICFAITAYYKGISIGIQRCH